MIVESESLFYKSATVWPFDSNPCHRVECDRCRAAAPWGHDVGNAADVALKAGFVRVPGKRLTDPMLFVCSACAGK